MKYSIRTKITIIFFIGIVMVSLLFSALAKLQDGQLLSKIRINQDNAINLLASYYDSSNLPDNLEGYFNNFYLSYVKDIVLQNKILKESTPINTIKTPFGDVQIISYDNLPYLKFEHNQSVILLQSTLEESKNTLLLGYVLLLIMFGSFYFSIYKSLLPLKKLKADIKRLANGDIDTMLQINTEKSDNEIMEVTIEFNKAAKQIRDLLVSRQLFLRTIMHELKTPIGKGRIMSEMVVNDSHRIRLVSIFERLNMLIDEFGRIEQLLSKNYSLNYKEYPFSLILDQVKDLLMLDNFENSVQVEQNADPLLLADFQLFSLAIKNLLDNALKYANDKKAILICNEDRICIKNKGKELTYPIEHYLQAFVREKSSNIAGMGLGLYIINTICTMHKYTLKYTYEDGYHCFCVVLNGNRKI